MFGTAPLGILTFFSTALVSPLKMMAQNNNIMTERFPTNRPPWLPKIHSLSKRKTKISLQFRKIKQKMLNMYSLWKEPKWNWIIPTVQTCKSRDRGPLFKWPTLAVLLHTTFLHWTNYLYSSLCKYRIHIVVKHSVYSQQRFREGMPKIIEQKVLRRNA